MIVIIIIIINSDRCISEYAFFSVMSVVLHFAFYISFTFYIFPLCVLCFCFCFCFVSFVTPRACVCVLLIMLNWISFIFFKLLFATLFLVVLGCVYFCLLWPFFRNFLFCFCWFFFFHVCPFLTPILFFCFFVLICLFVWCCWCLFAFFFNNNNMICVCCPVVCFFDFVLWHFWCYDSYLKFWKINFKLKAQLNDISFLFFFYCTFFLFVFVFMWLVEYYFSLLNICVYFLFFSLVVLYLQTKEEKKKKKKRHLDVLRFNSSNNY